MILLLSDDLIDASKVLASARAEGEQAVQIKSLDRLAIALAGDPPTKVIVDLHFPGLDLDRLVAAIASLPDKPRLVGYGSHVDAERLRAARRAGFDEVLPRSEFFST